MLPGMYQSYYGGKNGSGVYQKIINCIRPHDVYMELFLGNGAVFRHKKPAKFNILNDLSKTVYEKWQAATLGETTLHQCDTIDFLKNYKFDPTLKYCIYLDPPYPIQSRKEGRKRYECEMTDQDHEELLEILKNLPSNIDIIISTYENEIYKNALVDWHLETFNARTRQYTAIEFLYMNYNPKAGILHQYDYLGEDFTDRQRIKRKIEREIEKLRALPNAERNAIIQAVIDLA